MSQYRAIRGMVDVLPDETPLWQMLEQTARDVLARTVMPRFAPRLLKVRSYLLGPLGK